MKPDKASVYELFQLERRYVVPLYQRPYVWTQDAHWAPLWDDVEATAMSITTADGVSPHFLGAIVLAGVTTAGVLQITASHVIDGQQRLTTLQVFLAAFRDVVGELGSSEANEAAKQTLDTIFKRLGQITEHPNVLGGNEDRFKVWPTNADRPVFEAVMTARSRAKLDERFDQKFIGKRKKTPVPGPRLVEAYRYFEGKVRAFLTKDAADGDPVNARTSAALSLFETVQRGLQLVVIGLDDSDDPQVIFETLNARGEPLLPSDLIRNLVFNRAGNNADELYENYWLEFDENAADGTPGFWKTKVAQGREVRPVLDLFFHSLLTARVEAVVPLAHLFKEFRKWWTAESAKPLGTALGDLRKYADAYRSFHEPGRLPPEDHRLAALVGRLRVLDTAMVYPVLLFLVVEAAEQIDRARRDAMLVDLESFLVRRWICGVTSKNYNRFFPALVGELRKAGAAAPEVLRARLVQAGGIDRWPADKEFENAWLIEPAYEYLGSPGVRMVLSAIHGELLGKKQEKVALPTSLTVEHVMPQAWSNKWSEPSEMCWSKPHETVEEARDRVIHTFGNLTLLTQELNSELRDGVYANKRPAITQQSLLLLNAYFQAVEEWDEKGIGDRGEALLKHAKRIWPKPTVPA